ncbi:MAG: hypothetical protein Sylvanvirus6_17 [Sylvanvirus sp.]|uniref:Uncharacterized protein n=1 Tax=Sylvanvirus sp. TaxID=2487774 RepID=A0A3G5AHP5_9VIRU|nr:MAG: hypothetical protein Sylvanvirus6_17 [Sylvanvirus sp.]
MNSRLSSTDPHSRTPSSSILTSDSISMFSELLHPAIGLRWSYETLCKNTWYQKCTKDIHRVACKDYLKSV